MFSGTHAIKTSVVSHEYKSGSLFLVLQKPQDWTVHEHAHIAVNGISLPVRAIVNNNLVTEAIQEVIKKTTLGLTVPPVVHCEKALSPIDGVSGHLVYGAIDAIGILEEIENEESSKLLTFSYPEEHNRFFQEKAFIAVDGLSAQIIDCDDDQFTVRYPHFILDESSMGLKKIGEYGNIEIDMMIRYLDKIMEYKK